MIDISAKDLDDLEYAKSLLENPGLAARITNFLGTPIEKGFALLPGNWSKVVSFSTRKALQAAVNSAILTIKIKRAGEDPDNALHKMMVAGSGAVGGFCGLPALPIELPVLTTIYCFAT